MTEQEYKDKLQVREQLSLADRLRLLEYEFNLLIDVIPEQQRPIGLIRESKGKPLEPNKPVQEVPQEPEQQK